MTVTAVRALAAQLDSELEELSRVRDRVLAAVSTPERSLRLAELYWREAQLWSALFALTRTRLQWRAALGAEAHARARAAYWQRRALRPGGGAR